MHTENVWCVRVAGTCVSCQCVNLCAVSVVCMHVSCSEWDSSSCDCGRNVNVKC